METFAIKKKEAEPQKPVIVQKHRIQFRELKYLLWSSHPSRRSIGFGNEGNDNHLQLLFTEIAEQDNISDILIIPGYPVLVKKNVED